MTTVLLPLITLVLGFVASFLLDLLRNRWTTRTTRELRDAERRQAAHADRVAFERDGLRTLHTAIHELLNRVNAISIAQAKAEGAGLDWRETDDGAQLRSDAMHANVRCSHESALLLHPPVIEAVERLTTAAYPLYWTRESGTDPGHSREFYEAVATATRAIAVRLRELYGFEPGDS